MKSHPVIALPALLALSLSIASAAAQDSADGDPRINEKVLVERVVWPVFLEPKRCRSIPPASIVVTEDGVNCPVLAIEQEQPARIHAILIDNSGSMASYLPNLELAAVDYVRKCPESEPVIVTSFANNVVLEAGLSTDRKGQIAGLEELRPGHETALLDAIYYMLRYLEPRPERKVAIVFTDTMDNTSLGRHSAGHLLTLARSIPNLTVFVIHMQYGKSGLPSSENLLARLVEATGGNYSRPELGATFVRIFSTIRKRLDSEVFISYAPPRFGDGPRDDPERGYRLREVDLSVRPGVGCRVVSAGSPLRLSGRPPSRANGLRRVDLSAGETLPPSARGAAPGRSAGWRIREKLRFPVPESWPAEEVGESHIYVVDPPTRLLGRALDIAEEKGARYDPALLDERGRFLPLTKLPPAFSAREFAVDLPPLDSVRRRIRTPVDILFRLMEDASPSARADAPTGGRHPLFVHGQTWLELRPYLAEAIYRARDDYRSWADAKLGEEHLAKVDHVLEQYCSETEVSEAEIPRLREFLLGQVPAPGPDSVHAYLAEWLGDVPAHDLAYEFQLEVARRMLRTGESRHYGSESDLEVVGPFWARMVSWMPPPSRVRVVTPLVPAYDARRDVVGFYRFSLPHFRGGGPPVDLIPERPFGLEILDMLLEDDDVAAALRGNVRVEELTVTALKPAPTEEGAVPLYPTRAAADRSYPPHAAFQTNILFQSAGRESFELTGLHVRAAPGSKDFALVCLRTDVMRRPHPDEPNLRTHVNGFISRWKLACLPDSFDGYLPVP